MLCWCSVDGLLRGLDLLSQILSFSQPRQPTTACDWPHNDRVGNLSFRPEGLRKRLFGIITFVYFLGASYYLNVAHE